jgi:hypothetical protein
MSLLNSLDDTLSDEFVLSELEAITKTGQTFKKVIEKTSANQKITHRASR